ncbi:MAG: hypothetical protein Q8R12_05410 [bacterium]|nr:hypothetical protein [bacterium]
MEQTVITLKDMPKTTGCFLTIITLAIVDVIFGAIAIGCVYASYRLMFAEIPLGLNMVGAVILAFLASIVIFAVWTSNREVVKQVKKAYA